MDTQFVLALLVEEDSDHQAAHQLAGTLKALVLRGHAEAFLSLLTLDELAWKLCAPVHDRDHGRGAWRRLAHKAKKRIFDERRALIVDDLQRLLGEPWLKIAPVTEGVCHLFPQLLGRYPLAPADASHLAIALGNRIPAIVTNDRDFGSAGLPLAIVHYSESGIELEGP
jgi:predicted nucleic acid-binding protein